MHADYNECVYFIFIFRYAICHSTKVAWLFFFSRFHSATFRDLTWIASKNGKSRLHMFQCSCCCCCCSFLLLSLFMGNLLIYIYQHTNMHAIYRKQRYICLHNYNYPRCTCIEHGVYSYFTHQIIRRRQNEEEKKNEQKPEFCSHKEEEWKGEKINELSHEDYSQHTWL